MAVKPPLELQQARSGTEWLQDDMQRGSLNRSPYEKAQTTFKLVTSELDEKEAQLGLEQMRH